LKAALDLRPNPLLFQGTRRIACAKEPILALSLSHFYVPSFTVVIPTLRNQESY
jgi:hypothetical protein